MKKIFIMAVLAVLVATPAMAASVAGSKHDMIGSGFATGYSNSEVCIFCHTPHGAQIGVTQAPLWNNTPVDVTEFYGQITVPPGSEINFPPTDLNAINATDARLCLACHASGVTLPFNMPNTGDIDFVGATAMNANTLLGSSLANDHPIGMDLGANPETNPSSGVGGLKTLADIRGGATGFGEDPFPGDLGDDGVNIMWCSSCHNVHDNGFVPFLRKNNAGSALCKACHKK